MAFSCIIHLLSIIRQYVFLYCLIAMNIFFPLHVYILFNKICCAYFILADFGAGCASKTLKISNQAI